MISNACRKEKQTPVAPVKYEGLICKTVLVFMQTIIRQIIITSFIGLTSLKGQVTFPSNIYSETEGSLYWAGTIAFSTINVTTTYYNIKKLHKNDKYRSNAIFGAISGCAQTALGFANVNAKYKNAFIPTSINIGVGLTTLITSVIRLSTKNPPKENNISLNVIYFPDNHTNNSVVGLTFKKQF